MLWIGFKYNFVMEQNQWANEFKKEGTKVFGLFSLNLVIGVCVFHW